MPNRRSFIFHRTGALIALACFPFVVAVWSATPASSVVGPSHVLTPAEAKALSRSASTQADHLRLAAYFRDKAAQEKAAADLHERNAGSAERHDLKMADEHERIAQAMRDGSPFGVRHSR